MLQIFDLQHDEAERHNLAPAANASLLKALHDVRAVPCNVRREGG